MELQGLVHSGQARHHLLPVPSAGSGLQSDMSWLAETSTHLLTVFTWPLSLEVC